MASILSRPQCVNIVSADDLTLIEARPAPGKTPTEGDSFSSTCLRLSIIPNSILYKMKPLKMADKN